MATGSLDANGIWQYGEDDSEPTFSGLLNKLAESTSTKVSSLKASDTTSGTFAVARIPNLQDLNGTLDIASGGTGATTALAARDALQIGLANLIPSSVTAVSGSGSANSMGVVSFYSVTSVSLNGIFSAEYNNFKIIVNVYGTSTISNFNLRLRNGTTDYTGTDYNKSATTTNRAGTTAAYSATGANLFNLASFGTDHGFATIDISNPYKAFRKGITFSASGYAGTNFAAYYGAGEIDDGGLRDGLTLFPSSGTITGWVQVYGYND